MSQFCADEIKIANDLYVYGTIHYDFTKSSSIFSVQHFHKDPTDTTSWVQTNLNKDQWSDVVGLESGVTNGLITNNGNSVTINSAGYYAIRIASGISTDISYINMKLGLSINNMSPISQHSGPLTTISPNPINYCVDLIIELNDNDILVPQLINYTNNDDIFIESIEIIIRKL